MKRLLLLLISCAFALPAFGQSCNLEQSTASQEISIGPFLSAADGDTEETGLTIANTDVRLKRGSADWTSKNSGGATAEEHGNYRITLDATDTSTVGILEIYVHVAPALAVWKTCYVFIAATYTAYYGSSATGYVDGATVNSTKIGGTSQTGRDIGASVLLSNGTGSGQLSLSSGTVTVGTNNDKTGYGLASNSITAAVIADGAIDRATFAADTGLQTVRSNTAQAGAATTITLDASASASDSFYNNDLILITGGTGAGQARFVTGYVGSTKVATVATWVTNPTNTSTFAILPFDAVAGATAPTAAQIATVVWQDLLASSDFSTAASIGKLLHDDIDAAISSRLASASISLSGGAVTVGTNNDKTGYALTSAYDASKTAAQAGDTMKVSNGTGTGQIALTSGQVTVGTNSDKTGYALSTAGNNSAADALLDRANAIETNVTLRQFARLAAAALGGKTSGSGTATITFRDTNDTKNVIVCTVASGNRTSCMLNLN